MNRKDWQSVVRQRCWCLVPSHDGEAAHSQATEERATEDREEVANVHRHDGQHAGDVVSKDVAIPRTKKRLTASIQRRQ